MMAFLNSACFFLWAAFLLSFAGAAPTPVAEGDLAQSQALDIHNTEAGSPRCYYNFQHYEEGDRIITNEPCLNCTCHKRMLMCYLRVCPFTKPVSAHCTVEKKPDQCCPVITCPEVPVDIVTSSTTEAASSSSSAVGHVGQYGCTLEDNTFYPDGVQMPSDPKKPCELCYCIRNHTACVRQECTLNVEGCRPVYQDGVCCPVRYDCDYNEISTTERPSTGGLLLGTTASPTQQCHYGKIVYNDGELIETDKPCESCYCMRGDIVCAVRSCGEPMDGKNCHALPTPEGQCCPTTFQCANGTISIENMTTESSIMMHPSPLESEVSTKEPKPQPTAGGTSDGEGEDTKNEDQEADSSTEILPSDSPKGDENQEDKHEEEKVEDHPEEHILSEPTDGDELEDEEALASHPDHLDDVSESQSPDINEQFSTSGPDTADKVEIVTQSNIVSEINTSEESAGASAGLEGAEVDQQEKDDVTESIKDKIIPGNSESAGTEGESFEKQDIVTEIPIKSEETSNTQLEDDVSNVFPELTDSEVVTQSGESEQPKEPTLEQESVPAEFEDKKEEVAPTVILGEENPPIAPAGEQSVALNTDIAENSQPETHSTGIEADETKTESNQIMSLAGESINETLQQPEKEDATLSTNENEIKYEETPPKTPESLDQVKEQEIVYEIVYTSTSELPEVDTSEVSTASTHHNKQEENDDKEKEEVESTPKIPSVEIEPAAPSEESNPEHSEHFHKEQAPPRKEDASPEELEQRPQHPEGSMTKAEDSIPDGQVDIEATITELPVHVENPEQSHEVQGPSDVEKMPVDATESSIKHDGAHEGEDNEVPQEGQVQEALVVQTEQPITNEDSSKKHSEHEISQTSEVPETNETKDKTTEPATGTASSDVVNENDGTATIETTSSESPSSEIESVPTVIVIEPESETSTDSLPEESSHGEVKPETVPQDTIHDSSSDVADEHQSHQTEQPVETEEETTVGETAAQPEYEKQPAGVINVESGNVPTESTQSSSKVNAVEDGAKEETAEQSSHDEKKPSSEIFDNAVSLENSEKEPNSITGHAVISEILNKTEGKPATEETTPSEEEAVYLPTAGTYMLETEESGQSHSDTTESGDLPNEIKPDEVNTHKTELPTEPSVSVEESTNTLIKTGSESTLEETESEKKGEESAVESKPTETAANPTPESGSTVEEIHHDPVESEPTEFDDNEFEETSDHDSTSENEIDDQLSGHGGALDHETPSIIPGPIGVIPGEGDCLVDGQTYTNNSIIPSKSPCHKQCTCISSIVHCQGIDCPPPPPELANCMPVHQGDLCCPVYTCDGNTPESPQSHNQMGGNEENVTETEDHKTSNISHSGPLSSDSSFSEAEAPEHTIKPTEKSVTDHTSESLSNESETQKEDNEPMEHEGAGFQSGESSATVEDIPVSSEEVNTENIPEKAELSAGEVEKEDITPNPGTFVEDISVSSGEVKPEETPEKTELSESDVEKEDITPIPNTVIEEHEDESDDDKPPTENVTAKVNTPGEDSETKPDSGSESSESIPAEGENETQQTVLTDQSESHGAETQEPITTETPIFEESPTKPDEKNTVSEQDNLSTPSENEQPQQPEAPATETSQTFAGETQEAEGQKEPEVELDSTLATGTQAPSESVDVNLPSVTEKITEVNVESSGDHVPSEEIHPDKEPEPPSTDSSIEQSVTSIENSEDAQKTSEEAHVSDDVPLKNEITEQDVQEIGSETPVVDSQDEVIKQGTEVTQEPSDPEILITGKPNVEETSQLDETNETHKDASQSESEGQSKPAADYKPQTDDGGSEIPITEDIATEIIFRPTESLLENSKPISEVEGSSTDTDTTVTSVTGEEEGSTEQKPLDEHKLEESKPDDEHKIKDTVIETMTSQSVLASEAQKTQESEASNIEVASSTHEIEGTEPQEISATEGAAHDDTGDVDITIEETTENSVELQHELSTEAPSFDGPSTKAPLIEVEHSEDKPLEETKGPSSIETPVPNAGTSETVDAPESDNLIVDDTHVPSSAHQEATQDQSLETSSVSQDIKSESDTVKHEPETTEILKHGGSETSETTNEIEEHISQSPSQEVEQPEHEGVPPTHDTDIPVHESSESPKPADGQEEEEKTQEAENGHEEIIPVHSNEEQSHSTEITTEENANKEEESVNKESEPGHAVVESSDATEETVTEHLELVHEETEPVHEEPEPALEGTEPAHEESEQAHEEIEQAHEEPETAHEETEPVHEETEPSHEETEQAHEVPESAHEETEPAHEETEQAHKEPESVHEETETTHEMTEPAQEMTEPSHEMTEPAHEETVQAHEEPESAHEETEPAHEETEQAHKEPESVHEETKPAHEMTESAQEMTEPAHEETEQAHKESESAHEETETAHEETEQAHKEPESVHEETEPAHETTESAQEMTEPAHEETEQAHKEYESAHEEAEPAHEETVQAHEDPESDHEETEPAHEETGQAHKEPESVHEETEPAQEMTESAQEMTEPAHEETEQAHKEPESAHEETEPAHEETEQVHTEPETAHEDSEPAHEDTEQAHEEPESAHEESEPAHEDTEQPHEEPESVHEETEPAQEMTESAQEMTEPAHEETEQAHKEPESAHEESEPAHEDTEQPHEESESAHDESQPAHEDTEQAHEEPESIHEEPEQTHEESEVAYEETEQALEVTEPANEVSDHEGESDHVHETTTAVNEAYQSTPGPDLSENVPQESEHVDEHPVAESEHPVLESQHPGSDSDHVLEPNHQTHEAEQLPDENTIGEGEHPTNESEQGIHEPDQTIHETEIPHTQDSGSLPTMPGATHAVDDSKPQHSKPDDPELPPEEQFTPDVDMDYDVSEDGAFGPGTCRYGGKVYVSAQQIPRDDPCDFCFCFRSDIICLQQSCPPPIHRCHQEPIQGYCCPRYQCPVSMATSLNVTTTTSTTTTTLPPHFFAHAYRGAARQSGCFHRGRAYEVGEEIASASGPCLQCICGSDGQMRCDPKVCNPEPMVRKLMEAAVSHRRR